MSRTYPGPDFATNKRIIVGEGESDFKFWQAFCSANNINGFNYAFSGIFNNDATPSGIDVFDKFLKGLVVLPKFAECTDVVLVCDSAENQDSVVRKLTRQIRSANRAIGRTIFDESLSPNTVARMGQPRLHLLMLPESAPGGLETVCVNVARDHLNESGANGTDIEGWVNSFADSACVGWTAEKRDKLRLQAFISAAWPRKPDMHLSQLFDITQGRLVPLNGTAFDHARDFLRSVEAL